MAKSFSKRVILKAEIPEQPAVIMEHPIPIQQPDPIPEQPTVIKQKTTVFHPQTGIIQQVQLMNFIPLFFDKNIYLFNYTDKARWASGQLIDADNTTNDTSLPWMGSPGDSNGFVRLDDGVVMEDNQTYKVLRTHPKWVNNGTIKGWLPWVQQMGTGIFRAQVGFLNGATGTDGVTFQVWVHYHVNGVEQWESVLHQQKLYTRQLQEISVDLSKWANQEISIELRVDAGASSVQDWAAWINPRIEMGQVAVKIPGPIITNDTPAFFNDRYDVNTKWYLPDFELKQPLGDNFTFSCYKNAEPNIEDGKLHYNGEVSFTLSKNTPPAIDSLAANNAEVTYTEILLNNLCINFVLAFKDKQPVTYSGTVTQTDNDYTLSLESNKLSTSKEQESYLLTLFNFISNINNADWCTVSVTGSYFGYTPKPGQNDCITNASLLFTKVFNKVNYPCAAYPNNYFIKDNSTPPVSFGCLPPFGIPAADPHTFTLFRPQNVLLSEYGINYIYRNEYNFNYLIIPQKYTIMLERASHSNMEDQLVPAAYLTTVIDDSDTANCMATFQFHIAPDISAYQLWLIKKLIFDKTKTPFSSNRIDDIHIEFPENIYQPDTIAFDKVKKLQIITGLGSNEYGVRGSRYFQLEFQDVSFGDGSAGLVGDIIKGQMGGAPMAATISFDIDCSDTPHPKAVIEISLNKISGNGLLLQKNEADNKVYFLNRTFYDVSVTGITSDTEKIIDPALTVSKNNSMEAPIPVTVDNFSLIIPIYTYSLNQDYNNSVLAEMRVDVQNVSDIIIVTNNTGLFNMYKIAEVDIVIYILPTGETDISKAIRTVSKSINADKDGAINYVPFVLPVDQYSRKWSVHYSTTVIFTDGRNPQNNVQIIEDLNSIGNVINLTVSNLNLSKS